MSLYDDASLIMYPSGYKADKIYSLKPTNGSGDFDFTRASTATRVNADGLIESVATGVPRIDYTGGGCGKLKLEPQRTNLLTYSEQFENADWSKFNLSVTANDTTSPDGTVNADKIVEDATAPDTHGISQVRTTTSGVDYIAYIFAKKSERDFIYFRSNVSSSFNLQWFDLTNKTVGGTVGSFQDAGIIEYPNDWVLCYVKKTETTGTNRLFQWALSTGDLVETYTGDGTSGAFMWGAQVEAGSYPTSYIPTSNSQTTRSAETATGAGDVNTFNDSEGVLMAEISAFEGANEDRQISISDGSNSNKVGFQLMANGTQIQFYAESGGSSQVNTFKTIDATNGVKIGFSYKVNDFKVYLNGFLIVTDTSGAVPIGLRELAFDRGTGGDVFYGNTKQLQYFPSALTDAKLEEITSWTSFIEMAQAQNYKTY